MPRQELLHNLCQQSPHHPTGPPPRSFQKGKRSCSFFLSTLYVELSESKILAFELIYRVIESLLKWKHVSTKCFLPAAGHVMLCFGIRLNKPVVFFSVYGFIKWCYVININFWKTLRGCFFFFVFLPLTLTQMMSRHSHTRTSQFFYFSSVRLVASCHIFLVPHRITFFFYFLF